jgi:hypothetical protein
MSTPLFPSSTMRFKASWNKHTATSKALKSCKILPDTGSDSNASDGYGGEDEMEGFVVNDDSDNDESEYNKLVFRWK